MPVESAKGNQVAKYNYDRLSGQDTTFLLWETPDLHMHVASTLIFERGSLASDDGGVAFDRFKRFIDTVLHQIPPYRQKHKWVPVEAHPVWVDDPHFNIDYHVRHTSLPKPGSEAQLKKLAARVMAQQLDRDRPLWEIWLVEGLEADRFAMISKIHHCMIDGSSGVDISQILMRLTPDTEIKEGPRYFPRPEPTGAELVRDAVSLRLRMPVRALRGFRQFRRETENLAEEIALRTRAVRNAIVSQSTNASDTPINGPLGPHRLFDWWSVPLADVKAIRRGMECTVNDVVLTVVTSAFRSYLMRRRVDPTHLDFRVQAPVSVRSDEERGKLGNRVSGWLVRLPVGEADPRKQLERIHETTQELKDSHHALGADMIIGMMGAMPNSLVSLGAQAASGTMNSIVTNVPGPQFPLYTLGSELLAMYPQVPLLANVGLGIALISYNGNVCWGFNADLGLVPDLSDFVARIQESFAQLAEVAGVETNASGATGEV
jgi:diacylglycerol O-acyltransferase